ncbi:MAG TPA: PsbP-related protein [Nitrososphaeraceae archaeon]|nr:PsbP-related protein [Nitrososphaeraceae archaeon]
MLQDNTSFLTYTNTEMGFAMKYPPDWKVRENDVLRRYKVMFIPPNRGAYVAVGITSNVTPEVLARMKASEEQAPSSMSPGIRHFEGDYKHFSLSGYPAVRIIRTKNYEGPWQPYDVKGMVYGTLVDTTFYTVAYDVTPPEDFPRYLQTAQSMIDSFQIISKQ